MNKQIKAFLLSQVFGGNSAGSGDGSGGITPVGSVRLTNEGTYDVTTKATAIVDLSSTRAALAAAVTDKGVTTPTTASFAELITNIEAIHDSADADDAPKLGWTRPADWPAYTKELLEGQDVAYWTIDNKAYDTVTYCGVHSANTDLVVELGTLSNGMFVAYETHTVSKSTRFAIPTNPTGDRYTVVRISAVEGTHIGSLHVATVTVDGATYNTQYQPIVEMYQRLPYISAYGTYQISDVANYYTKAMTCLDYRAESKFVAAKASDAFHLSTVLEYLDFSGAYFGATTNLASFAVSRPCLKEAHLDNWIVPSGFTIASLLSDCYNLEKASIKGWSNKSPVSTYRLFYFDGFLEEFELDFNFDATTNVTDMFSSCGRIKKIDFSGEEFQGDFGATVVSNMFYNCISLEEVIMPDAVFSNTTKVNTLFTGCRKLKKIDLSSLNTSAATGSIVDGSPILLEDLKIGTVAVSLNLRSLYMLSHESLVNVINALTVVDTAHTLTCPDWAKSQLTADEIAIATAKGWTIA